MTAPFNATLSAAIDEAEHQAQRARELGWPTIAEAFERCRAELIGLVPDEEREP